MNRGCDSVLVTCDGCRTAGYTSIANIDVSRVVVDQMIERYREKNSMTCESPSPWPASLEGEHSAFFDV